MNRTTPSKPRQRKSRPKPTRFVGVALPMNDQHDNGVVRITVGNDVAQYFLAELPADSGRAFRVEQIGLELTAGAYRVNVNGESRTCDCQGHMRHGHCEHA